MIGHQNGIQVSSPCFRLLLKSAREFLSHQILELTTNLTLRIALIIIVVASYDVKNTPIYMKFIPRCKKPKWILLGLAVYRTHRNTL